MTAAHLHAMIIHFPIALLMAGFLSEIIALCYNRELFRKIAFYLLLLGAVGAIAAYISGSYAAEGIETGRLAEAIENHEEAALITLWIAVITAIYRAILLFIKYERPWTKWVGILLFAALIGSIINTGDKGGSLVYEHGAGLELKLPEFNEKVQ
ncbi:MAG: DUF2231 domain-containing protein [Salegentibacter sp.]